MSVPVLPSGIETGPDLAAGAAPRAGAAGAGTGSPTPSRAYVGLTKTRIIEQLLVVTVPAMFLAERGVPPVPLILATLVGGAAAAASAHALNCVIDADIDVKMKRTARRPLAKGQVPPSHALVFGLVLAALSTVWLWLTTNQLAAGLALTAIAFYVLVYTLILKRRTSQNIVWGGAAGCMPVVIGWAAVTGTRRVAGAGDVRRDLLLDAAALLGAGDALPRRLRRGRRADAAGGGHPGAGVAADRDLRVGDGGVVAAAGARDVVDLRGGRRRRSARSSCSARTGCTPAWSRAARSPPMTLFHLSNMYLCGLFAAIAVDAAVGLPVLGGLPF